MEVGFPYPDANSGLHAVVAILAALHHRRRTGRGQQIDVAMLECTVAVVAEGLVAVAYGEPQRPRLGNRSDYCSPHGVFRCRGEDRWVSIAVASDAQWLDLCAVMNRPDLVLNQDYQTLAGRKANEDRLEAEVERWTRSRDRWTVAEVLQERRIEAYPCMSGEDLAADPQLRARGAFVELEHPEVGVRQHIGPPWRFRRRRWQVDSPAPLLGQHTEATLKSLLGYSDEQIEELRGSGAIPDCSTRQVRGPGA